MGNTIAAANLIDVNGDTNITKKLNVTGVSTFNDNITLVNGKKINNVLSFDANSNVVIDTGKKINSLSFDANNNVVLDTGKTINSVDINALKTTVDGMAGAAGGTFNAISASSVSATGAGSFGSIKTTNIDINGDITSTTGKSYVLGSATNGLTLTNGQSSTGTTYGNIIIDATTGNISMNKPLKVGAPSGTGATQTTLSNDGLSADVIKLGQSNGAVQRVMQDGRVFRNILDTSDNLNVTSVTTSSNITMNGGNLQVKAGTTTLGATTATGLITANGGITSSGALTVTGATTLGTTTLGATTASGLVTANSGVTLGASSNLTVGGTTTLTGATTATGLITANGGVNTGSGNLTIGSGKWIIEENIDTNKGTRLCFGKVNAQNAKQFFTCMNAKGNLELY